MDIEVMKFRNGKLNLEVGSTIIDGELWFVGSLLAKELGYINTRDALSKHVWDMNKKVIHVDSFTFITPVAKCDGVVVNVNSDYTFVSEAGMYQLTFRSKLDKAREFQTWVFKEVLPSLRKIGAYIVVNKDDTVDDLDDKVQLAFEEANKKLEEMNDRLRYEEETNKVGAEEMENLIARNNYLEERNEVLTATESRLKKIVRYFLDRDKKEFIIRNDIREVPTDTIKYKKFLQDITNRLVSREPIYKDIRVPDYYDKEEDFYA